jgi:hypothetical protein
VRTPMATDPRPPNTQPYRPHSSGSGVDCFSCAWWPAFAVAGLLFHATRTCSHGRLGLRLLLERRHRNPPFSVQISHASSRRLFFWTSRKAAQTLILKVATSEILRGFPRASCAGNCPGTGGESPRVLRDANILARFTFPAPIFLFGCDDQLGLLLLVSKQPFADA